MIDFTEACRIAYTANLPVWKHLGFRGEYMVADYGFENSTSFLIVDGARELLDGGDYGYEIMDKPLTFIHKSTGAISHGSYMADMDGVNAMTLIGKIPGSFFDL